MSCPRTFYKQCNIWTVYAVISVSVFLITAAYLSNQGYTTWDILLKSGVAFGTATCVVWWLWVMKKLHDLAAWWVFVKDNVDMAAQLLAESKKDLSDIKGIAKQDLNQLR